MTDLPTNQLNLCIGCSDQAGKDGASLLAEDELPIELLPGAPSILSFIGAPTRECGPRGVLGEVEVQALDGWSNLVTGATFEVGGWGVSFALLFFCVGGLYVHCQGACLPAAWNMRCSRMRPMCCTCEHPQISLASSALPTASASQANAGLAAKVSASGSNRTKLRAGVARFRGVMLHAEAAGSYELRVGPHSRKVVVADGSLTVQVGGGGGQGNAGETLKWAM